MHGETNERLTRHALWLTVRRSSLMLKTKKAGETNDKYGKGENSDRNNQNSRNLAE